jgi:hypothetical protein
MVIDEPEDFARTVTGLREDGGLDRLQWLIADALADHTHTRQRAALRDLYTPAA